MDRDAVEHERRMDDIADRLQARFSDATGRHADDQEIDDLVHGKAAEFADAPLQEFVPLLIEHQASDALRERGMRPVGPTTSHPADGPSPARRAMPSTATDAEHPADDVTTVADVTRRMR